MLHRREVALPRPGKAVNQMASQPELRIGDVCELKPVLLARNFRGLEGHHEQLLFAKAEKVLDIEPHGVSLIALRKG